MKDKDEAMKAWGYYLAAMKRIIERNGREISDALLDDYTRRPRTAFVRLHKLVGMRNITEEEREEIGGILTAIDMDDDRGTTANPCSYEEQGIMLLAFHHYDKNQMTVKEAAEELGVSVQAVYKMLDSGTLRGLTRGGSKRVFASSVEHRKADKSK